MIFNIRGTSGSGKTYLGRQLVKHYGGTEITDEKGHIFGYRLPGNLWVMGRYDDAIKGGGADNITSRLFKRYQAHGGQGNSMDAIEAQVRKWSNSGHHVLFEGIIITSVWGRWVKLAQELPMTFLFLDTPFEVCYERLMQRNGGKVPKGYPGHSNMESFYHRQEANHIPETKARGFTYQIIEHQRAFEQVKDILEARNDSTAV